VEDAGLSGDSQLIVNAMSASGERRFLEEHRLNQLKPEISAIGSQPYPLPIELSNGRPDNPGRIPQECETGPICQFYVVAMNVVLNAVDTAAFVGHRPTMAGDYRIGMKVGYEDMPSGSTNTIKLLIRGKRIREVTKDKAAPDHIEFIGSKGHLSNVANEKVFGFTSRNHLRTQIDSNGTRNVADSSSDTTSCVNEACVRQVPKHFMRQFLIEGARRRLIEIRRCPEAIGLPHTDLFRSWLASEQ